MGARMLCWRTEALPVDHAVVVYLGVSRMKPFTNLILCAGAVALLSAGLYLADWACSGQQTPLMRNLTFADLLREMRRHEQLEADHAVLFPIAAEREKITTELIEGHLSLCAAADALREESESKPPHLRESLVRPAEQSIEEYFVRLAFQRAKAQLTNDPRRDAILPRLRAELGDYLYAQAAAQP